MGVETQYFASPAMQGEFASVDLYTMYTRDAKYCVSTFGRLHSTSIISLLTGNHFEADCGKLIYVFICLFRP